MSEPIHRFTLSLPVELYQQVRAQIGSGSLNQTIVGLLQEALNLRGQQPLKEAE